MLDKVYINGQCYLDLTDIIIKKEPFFYFLKFNFKKNLYVATLNKKQYYARLVAEQKIITNGEVFEPNTKGGYLAFKPCFTVEAGGEKVTIDGGIPKVKMGNDSFIMGSFTGTDLHNSFIKKGVKIGTKTLVGMDVELNKNVIIGDNCRIESTCKIAENSIIGNDTKLSCVKVGKNTLIGDNTELGLHTIDGKTALGETIYVGYSPNFYNYYFWDKGINPKDLGREKIGVFKKFIRIVREHRLNNKTTRIGEKVRFDCGVKIETGATVGNGAKLGYKVVVKGNAEVDNELIVPNKTTIYKKTLDF